MSVWILINDYNRAIRRDVLLRVINNDSAVLDDCENMAIELMRGYLAARYDVREIFDTVADARNPIILKYAIDIAIYYAYQTIAADQVPEGRSNNYDAAAQWLRRVQKQEINPPDLPLITDGTKDYVLMSSNAKRSNHIE